MPITPLTVTLAALLTAFATGLGALPFLFARHPSRTALGASNAAAGGLMLAASLMLFYEGLQESLALVLAGIAAGALFVRLAGRWLQGRENIRLGRIEGLDARKALLLLAVMTAHSFTEGIGVGVSYGGGRELGVFITAAIAVHNIPEGLAISLGLIPRGSTVWQAALWSVFSSLPQPLMALPAFYFVETFAPVLPAGLGFAAGAMAWMTFTDLLPASLEDAPRGVVAATFFVSIAAMLAFQLLLKG